MSASDPVWLATATEIVLQAGAIQLARRDSGFTIDKKGAIDLVTEVDLECERLCRQVIGERFPDHDILAEELGGGPQHRPGARHRWVFDPLDGTVNYAHRLPVFCSSLALEVNGRREVAAIFDPTRQELFTDERGQGAFLNGQLLSVSAAGSLIDAMLVTGFPYDVHQRAGDLVELFAAFLGRAQAVRRLGSAALDLCYVAAGRIDAFWEQQLKPWDVAAGLLIVEEAGGRISGMDGSAVDPAAGHLIASNGLIHEEMLGVIRGTPNSRSRLRTE